MTLPTIAPGQDGTHTSAVPAPPEPAKKPRKDDIEALYQSAVSRDAQRRDTSGGGPEQQTEGGPGGPEKQESGPGEPGQEQGQEQGGEQQQDGSEPGQEQERQPQTEPEPTEEAAPPEPTEEAEPSPTETPVPQETGPEPAPVQTPEPAPEGEMCVEPDPPVTETPAPPGPPAPEMTPAPAPAPDLGGGLIPLTPEDGMSGTSIITEPAGTPATQGVVTRGEKDPVQPKGWGEIALGAVKSTFLGPFATKWTGEDGEFAKLTGIWGAESGYGDGAWSKIPKVLATVSWVLKNVGAIAGWVSLGAGILSLLGLIPAGITQAIGAACLAASKIASLISLACNIGVAAISLILMIWNGVRAAFFLKKGTEEYQRAISQIWSDGADFASAGLSVALAGMSGGIQGFRAGLKNGWKSAFQQGGKKWLQGMNLSAQLKSTRTFFSSANSLKNLVQFKGSYWRGIVAAERKGIRDIFGKIPLAAANREMVTKQVTNVVTKPIKKLITGGAKNPLETRSKNAAPLSSTGKTPGAISGLKRSAAASVSPSIRARLQAARSRTSTSFGDDGGPPVLKGVAPGATALFAPAIIPQIRAQRESLAELKATRTGQIAAADAALSDFGALDTMADQYAARGVQKRQQAGVEKGSVAEKKGKVAQTKVEIAQAKAKQAEGSNKGKEAQSHGEAAKGKYDSAPRIGAPKSKSLWDRAKAWFIKQTVGRLNGLVDKAKAKMMELVMKAIESVAGFGESEQAISEAEGDMDAADQRLTESDGQLGEVDAQGQQMETEAATEKAKVAQDRAETEQGRQVAGAELAAAEEADAALAAEEAAAEAFVATYIATHATAFLDANAAMQAKADGSWQEAMQVPGEPEASAVAESVAEVEAMAAEQEEEFEAAAETAAEALNEDYETALEQAGEGAEGSLDPDGMAQEHVEAYSGERQALIAEIRAIKAEADALGGQCLTEDGLKKLDALYQRLQERTGELESQHSSALKGLHDSFQAQYECLM